MVEENQKLSENQKKVIMTIQFNTDKTINGDERNQDFFTSQIAEELDLYHPG